MRVNGRRTCAFCTFPIRPADSAEDSLIESTWMAEPSVSTKDYRDIVVRYALAVLAPLLAIYLRSLLNPLMGTANLYHTVWAAIVFSAWYCGFAPSILSTIVAAVGIWLWLLPRQGPFGVSSADFYGMIGFILFAGLIVAVGESNRRSRSRLTAAEREAQRTKTMFETFMDNSPAMTYLKDQQGRLIYANRALRERFHLPPLDGQTGLDIFPSDVAPEYRKNDALVLQEGKALEFIERTREEDGEHIWLTVKFPMQDPDGQLLLGGKSFEITDRQRAEEALEEARQELELRVQERTAELNKANQSLRELSARLLQMRDEERRRLARELHDSVGQLAAAVSMNIGRLEEQAERLGVEGAQLFRDTKALVAQIASEIRTISHLLHPPLLDEIGLTSALHWYVEEFSKRSKIETKIESPSDLGRLPADMEMAIFRIVQECLANIHRHSGSEIAAIRVEKEADRIIVVARDAGRGIPPERIAGITEGLGGVGFRGMAERLRYLGGNLVIDSNGAGTVVTATLPLKPVSRGVL